MSSKTIYKRFTPQKVHEPLLHKSTSSEAFMQHTNLKLEDISIQTNHEEIADNALPFRSIASKFVPFFPAFQSFESVKAASQSLIPYRWEDCLHANLIKLFSLSLICYFDIDTMSVRPSNKLVPFSASFRYTSIRFDSVSKGYILENTEFTCISNPYFLRQELHNIEHNRNSFVTNIYLYIHKHKQN